MTYDGNGLRRTSTTVDLRTTGTQPPTILDRREWLYGGASGEEEVAEALGAIGPAPAVHQVVQHVGGYRVAQGTTRFALDGVGSSIGSVDANPAGLPSMLFAYAGPWAGRRWAP